MTTAVTRHPEAIVVAIDLAADDLAADEHHDMREGMDGGKEKEMEEGMMMLTMIKGKCVIVGPERPNRNRPQKPSTRTLSPKYTGPQDRNRPARPQPRYIPLRGAKTPLHSVT